MLKRFLRSYSLTLSYPYPLYYELEREGKTAIYLVPKTIPVGWIAAASPSTFEDNPAFQRNTIDHC
jgi:hypothetical protein